MAMSTMLYNENPPLRNEPPVDLATTSPLPGRAHEQVCSLGLNPSPCGIAICRLEAVASDYRQLSAGKVGC